MARESDEAVLFRRGPSKQVQLIRWETSTDRFEQGQWFKGRIYERRCDLSPNGRLLVYFAATWKERHGPMKGSWTAVSRPPYLTALARWTKGDAWNGGGLFLDNARLGLNNGLHPHRWAGDPVSEVPLEISELNLGQGEDWPIENVRELRDGWHVVQEMDVTEPKLPTSPPAPMIGEDGSISWEYLAEYSTWLKDNDISKGYVTHTPFIIEKKQGPWTLRREERLDVYTRTRRYSVPGCSIDLEAADWAEWDHRKRLIYTVNGRILAAELRARKRPEVVELIDLGSNRFAPMKPPPEALEWPSMK